jgi:FG-GAP-like repeat/Subtilase family
MQIDARPDRNIAKAPGEPEAGAEVVNYNLLADKTGVDGGHGTTDNQTLGSIDLGSPLQLAFVPPSHPGGMPVATGGDESANAGEGLSAAPLWASSDTSADPVHSTLDPFEPLLTEASALSGSAIGTQIQDFNAADPSVGLHIAPPADSGFMATATVLFGPATPAPAPVVLANLAPISFGPFSAEASASPGAAPETVVGHQTSHSGPDAVAPTESASDLAHLENSAAGSPIVNSTVGPGGATAAQVQQALDENGLSVNGSGIKVGVLSDSFNDLGGAATDEADGALPSASNIDVIKDLGSGGTDEGRAMMQIIHDIAPGASEAFYTAFDSEQDCANGILALAAAGSKVIVDDVGYFDEPFFQNGVVAQAIQTVEAEGVTYVTAAGNDASNGYQAAWTPISGSFDGTFLTDAESFGGSLVQTVTINTEGTGDDVPLVLQWNQPYGAATSDLEIVVFHNGILYGEFSNINAGQELHNPLVVVHLPSGTYQVAIENLSGPNPSLIKEITAGDGFPATISGANTGTVVGHAMTPGAITAGAVSAADTPAFGFDPASESFSSSGAGAELLFANNGTALSSPDVLSPVAVSGVDDISTTVSGDLGDFYGTSAASASLAGVAALILSADPNLTPAQVEQIMEQTALPMSNSEVSGAGLVQVDPAVAAALNFDTNLKFVGEGNFSAGGDADLVWQNGGRADLWVSNGSTLTQVAVPDGSMGAEWSAYGIGDFNGDGNADLLWTNNSGEAAIWEMNGANIGGVGLAGIGASAGQMGAEWHVAGIGDFNGDRDSDILWVSTTGQAAVWTMSGTTLASVAISNGVAGPGWHVAAIGDFNNDGRSDVLWESSSGNFATWEMNGANLSGFVQNVGQVGAGWQIAGVGHFNGAADSTSDIVLVNSTTNHVQIWQMQNGEIADFINPSGLDGLEWHLEAVGNFAGDGNSDLLWISNSGATSIWEIHGSSTQVISVSAPVGDTLQLGNSVTASAAQLDNAGTQVTNTDSGGSLEMVASGTGATSVESGGSVVTNSAVVDSVSGTLSFSESDSTGTPSASVSPQNGGAGYLGNFTVDAVNTVNGQESVGWHFNFDSSSVAQTVTQSYDVTVADNQANGPNGAVSQAISVTVGGPDQDTFVFKPGFGTDVIANAKGSDVVELDGFASVSNINQLQTLLSEAQAGESQSVFQSANGGHDTVVNLGNHDSITLANVKIADLHASNFIIHG